MELNKLQILQHNVRHWDSSNFALNNIYRTIDPHIILINSHGKKKGEIIKIYNYDVYQRNVLNETNSGVAIAIRKDTKYRINESYTSDMISVTIETSLGEIDIATAYVPFRIGYIHYPDFFKFFTQKNPAYFLGDINARHRTLGHYNNNAMGHQLQTLIDRNHAIHIGPYFPTFYTHRSKTTPDIILCNNKTIHNHYAEPGPATPSDHTPVLFTINSSPIQIKIKSRKNFKKANWESYTQSLSTVETYDISNANSETIDKLAIKWTNTIKEADKEYIPTTEHRTIPHIKSNHRTRVINIMHKAQCQDIIDNGTSIEKYSRLIVLRCRLQMEYLRLKKEQWETLITNTDLERNSKDFWTSIKRMIGNNSVSQQKYLKDNNNQEIYDDEGKEKLFREYWSKVFTISPEENAEFDPEKEREVNDYILQNNDKIESHPIADVNRLIGNIRPTELWEVKKIINGMKQKSPGEDEITKYHLTNLPNNMLINLKNIINAALSMGHYPTVWKTSIMIFLPKPNKSPLEHSNYRPISLLSVPGKICEKVINNRVMYHLTRNNLHNCNQHGFRPGLGTGTATATTYEAIAAGKANGMKINIVLRDISRAFDKVWHAGLIYKMLKNDLPDALIRVTNSYLKKRIAKIRIGDYTGEIFGLKSGVPQGGCLSPTLFNFYTHDVPEASGENLNLIYADDITQIIRYRGPSEKMLALQTMREIEKVNSYEKQWKIKTNRAKFQIIPILRTKTEPIIINNDNYEYDKEGKALGLTIATNGFRKHSQNRINLAKIQLKNLYRFRDLSVGNKRKLYYALVKSVLEYPPVPLHVASNTQIKQMQIVQNKAARIITNTRYRDRETNQTVNELAELEPINISLHNQANSIWTKLEQFHNERTRQLLTIDEDRTETSKFPSSHIRAMSNPPNAIY